MSQKIKIGVSGNKGSFSEEAARYYAHKRNMPSFGISYLISVQNALHALMDGKIDKAIFPIENSNGGVVTETIYAMSNFIFKIEEMFEIDIQMNLMVLPGMTTKKVSRIISHQQALRQCRMYLHRKWQNTELEEYVDTASAAKDLSEGILPKTAAVIAPKICSKLYKLDILEEGIQDLKFNFTTFIVAKI
jgi:prephenate dehydratase